MPTIVHQETKFSANATGTTTPSIDKPTSLSNGQVLILLVTVAVNTGTISTPSGFAAASGLAQRGSGTGSRSQFFAKQITDASSEPSSYSASYSNAGGCAITLYQISDVASSSPIEANSAAVNTSGTSRVITFGGNVSDQSLNLFSLHTSSSNNSGTVSWSAGGESYDSGSSAAQSSLSLSNYTQSGTGTPTSTASWTNFSSATGVGCSIKHGTAGGGTTLNSSARFAGQSTMLAGNSVALAGSSAIRGVSAFQPTPRIESALSFSTKGASSFAAWFGNILDCSVRFSGAGEQSFASALTLASAHIVRGASSLRALSTLDIATATQIVGRSGLGCSSFFEIATQLRLSGKSGLQLQPAINLAGQFGVLGAARLALSSLVNESGSFRSAGQSGLTIQVLSGNVLACSAAFAGLSNLFASPLTELSSAILLPGKSGLSARGVVAIASGWRVAGTARFAVSSNADMASSGAFQGRSSLLLIVGAGNVLQVSASFRGSSGMQTTGAMQIASFAEFSGFSLLSPMAQMQIVSAWSAQGQSALFWSVLARATVGDVLVILPPNEVLVILRNLKRSV